MKDIYWTSMPTTICGSDMDNTKYDENNRVETKHNKIYFYSEVSRGKNLKLNLAIKALEGDLLHGASLSGGDPRRIFLHINSYGGSVFAGFSSVDYITKCKVPITSVIDGCAASAATIMSVTANHRQMNNHAYMLIHQLSSGMWGNYEALRDSMENCDTLMETIRGIYDKHTKIPKKQLNDILKRDLWFDAETCLKYGLVDHIIG